MLLSFEGERQTLQHNINVEGVLADFLREDSTEINELFHDGFHRDLLESCLMEEEVSYVRITVVED